VLDYPLAAVLIAGPLVLDFDYTAATVIALVLGGARRVAHRLIASAARTTGQPGWTCRPSERVSAR